MKGTELMTYSIIAWHGVYPQQRKVEVRTADSFADAIKLAGQLWQIIDLEHDALHQGCADYFTACGQVMSIEPQGFSLEKAA
jgi:hypothetical protein